MKPNKNTFEQRLLEKIQPVTESGCWIWMASVNRKGYGQISRRNRPALAHRASYELFVGEIPTEMCVLHRCDTPCCINPSHLFLGTKQENNRDMAQKRRSTIGERNPFAKLTELQIQEIKRLKGQGLTHIAIARIFSVDTSNISVIVSGKTWGWVK